MNIYRGEGGGGRLRRKDGGKEDRLKLEVERKGKRPGKYKRGKQENSYLIFVLLVDALVEQAQNLLQVSTYRSTDKRILVIL